MFPGVFMKYQIQILKTKIDVLKNSRTLNFVFINFAHLRVIFPISISLLFIGNDNAFLFIPWTYKIYMFVFQTKHKNYNKKKPQSGIA